MKVVEKYIEILTYKNYSVNTIKTYSHYLEVFLNDIGKNPYHITTKEIESYLIEREYSSISQQNQFIGSLKLFAKYILKKKDFHLDKIERPKKEKKLPRIIEPERLRDSILSVKNKKHKAILALGFSCGLRVSEVVNLKRKDIDVHLMRINIRDSKGRKDRIVKMSNQLLEIIIDYGKSYRPKTYLFNGQNSIQYSTGSCQNIFKRHIDQNKSFHTLRHSFGTALVENGTNQRLIQQMMGHESPKTTEIYTHVSRKAFEGVSMPL